MPIIAGGAGTPNNVQSRIIDVVAELQGINNSGTSAAERWVNRAMRPTPDGMSGVASHVYLNGGVQDIQRDVASNVRVVQQTSGAGQRTTQLMQGPVFIPSGAVAGATNGPVPTRPLRRYTAEEVLTWPVRGATVIELGLVFGNGMLTFLGTEPAFVLSSDPGVNAGRFTARVRIAPAGAITTLNDTGISPLTVGWQRFGVRLTEGPSPLLELLIDGLVVASRQGAGQLPVNSSGSFFAGVMGFGCSAAAGTTVQRAYSRYYVDELG